MINSISKNYAPSYKKQQIGFSADKHAPYNLISCARALKHDYSSLGIPDTREAAARMAVLLDKAIQSAKKHVPLIADIVTIETPPKLKGYHLISVDIMDPNKKRVKRTIVSSFIREDVKNFLEQMQSL